MIILEKVTIGQIPVLHLVDQEKSSEALPFVIFQHGFTSAKEHNLHYAYLLAEKGFRVALPEALHHGERQENIKNSDLPKYFWDIVLHSIDELQVICDFFAHNGAIDQKRVGVVGTSMGGIVTLGALTKYSWIKTAASLMGCPSYEVLAQWQLEQMKKQLINVEFADELIEKQLTKIRPFDLSQQTEKLANRPLMFWHAKNDPLVPYSFTYEFYEAIRPHFQENPSHLKMISDEAAGHKVSREGVLATVGWFAEHL